MPRIIRFFPVNHDINADPELWELTDRFGDRALRVWLEILSIADRNRGELPGKWEHYPSILAGRCKSTARHLVTVCQWLTRWLEIDSEGVARVRNYSKYHKTRGENSGPPNLTKPNLTYKENTLVDAGVDDRPQLKLVKPEEPKPDMSVQEFVESWNDVFAGVLPQVVWPLSPSRQRKAAMRLKEHRQMDFWRQVFRNIFASDFLTGKRTGWKCNFDFVIANDSNAVKIYEGTYDNGANESRRSYRR